jgi:hypothetical protein
MTATILENRRKWIDYLKQPDTKKTQGFLVAEDNHEARCCLGHACHVLGTEYDADTRHYEDSFHYPPDSVVEALGLWNHSGGREDELDLDLPSGYGSLSRWNDESNVTPQQIAAYLETVIMGGEGTPFRPIDA